MGTDAEKDSSKPLHHQAQDAQTTTTGTETTENHKPVAEGVGARGHGPPWRNCFVWGPKITRGTLMNRGDFGGRSWPPHLPATGLENHPGTRTTATTTAVSTTEANTLPFPHRKPPPSAGRPYRNLRKARTETLVRCLSSHPPQEGQADLPPAARLDDTSSTSSRRLGRPGSDVAFPAPRTTPTDSSLKRDARSGRPESHSPTGSSRNQRRRIV